MENMTVLYFSSTGNCLYVAKRIGGERYSIPNLVTRNQYSFEDDSIGIVIPVFGLCIPPYVEEFLKKMEVTCDYFFAIATYGTFPGAVCSLLNELCIKNGRKFDYINRLKMAQNCITFSDMAKQQGDSARQQKDIQRILDDIGEKKKFICSDTIIKKVMTSVRQKNFEYPMGVGITEKVSINENCSGCGICEKICPMKNITLVDGRPVFGKNCSSCGGCMQNCPKIAIHHMEEKSGVRYRNPHIMVNELFLESGM